MNLKERIIINKYRNNVCVTKHEKKIRRFLNELNIYYESQYPFKYNDSFILVDIIIPNSKLIIEIDGKHHYKSDKYIDDLKRDKFLNDLGLRVFRIMNDNVKNMTLDDFKKIILCPCCNLIK